MTFYFAFLRQISVNDNLPFKARKNFIKITQNLLIYLINQTSRTENDSLLNQYIKQTRMFANVC